MTGSQFGGDRFATAGGTDAFGGRGPGGDWFVAIGGTVTVGASGQGGDWVASTGGTNTSSASGRGGDPFVATKGGTALGGSLQVGGVRSSEGGSSVQHEPYSGGGTVGQSTLQYHGGFGGFICDFESKTFVGGQTLVDLEASVSCSCAYSGRFICWANSCSVCSFAGVEYLPGNLFSPDSCTACSCTSTGKLTCNTHC